MPPPPQPATSENVKFANDVKSKRRENEELNLMIERTVQSLTGKLSDQMGKMSLLSAKLTSTKDELATFKQHLLLPGSIHQKRLLEFSTKLISVDVSNPPELW